jgi:Holliday junction resolvase
VVPNHSRLFCREDVKKSRDKGLRGERNLVNILRSFGLRAERVPLSGAAHYKGGGHDVDVYRVGRDAPLCGECKIRASGWKELYKFLDENDFLAVKADRKDYLIVMPMAVFRELMVN